MKIETLRKRAWLALVPLSLVLLVACTKVQSPDAERSSQDQTLSANGTGQVTAAADVAVLDLGVSVLRPTVEQAQADAARAMDAVLDALLLDGVAEEDIATTQFSIFPEYDYTRDGERELRGFRLMNQVRSKIRNVEDVGEIIDNAIRAGGDDIVVNSISFTIDDTTALADQARELAVKDALRKAEHLADLAGVRLGRVVSLSEAGGGLPPPVVFQERAMIAGLDAAVATPISEGQVIVSLSVFVIYAIE